MKEVIPLVPPFTTSKTDYAQELNLEPESPADISLVDSQRDLLLRAVQLLWQRSSSLRQPGSHSDTSTDIKLVLQELDTCLRKFQEIPDSISIFQELHTPRTISDDTPNSEDKPVGPDLKIFERCPWPKVPFADPDINPQFPRAAKRRDTAELSNSSFHMEGTPDGSYHRNNLLSRQWNLASNNTYLGYDVSTTFSSFGGIGELQQQIWQDGAMVFLDTDVEHDSFERWPLQAGGE